MKDRQNNLSPFDPRWPEILRTWPIARRCLMLMNELITEYPENIDQPEHGSVESSSETRRSHRRTGGHSVPPVEEVHLAQIDRQRLSDTFERYEAVKHKLERKQWTAVYLRFREGLTQTEIARLMRLRHQSGVCALLKRAEHTLEEYERALREERFRLTRKYVNRREDM